MAQAGVIRDFMVALGFTTDKSKAEEMKESLKSVEVRAGMLHKALIGLAIGAVAAVTKTANELDKLYFSSQRIGASVTNINAYGNAIAQMGGSAEGAIGSLESLAEKMRNSPGYEGMINSLGVQTKDANGAMRDRVEVMKDLSGVLSKMPAHQANAYASSLGIDQNTLLAMRDGKFVSNMDKYQKIQKELGMNDDLAKSGNEFMTEYRDLTMMTKTGFQVLVMQAGKALIPILKLLNTMIQAGIHAFSQLHPAIKGVLSAGMQLGMFALVLNGVYRSLIMLKTGLTVLKMFIPALKAFRLAFLASPLGIILALAAAFALLYDDYKTWKEGGKSFFDWSKWTGGFDKIMKKIKDFLALLEKVKDKVVNFVQKIVSDPIAAVQDVVETAKDVAKNAIEEAVKPNGEPSNDTVKAVNQVSKTIVDKTKEAAKKAAEVAVAVAKATQQAVTGAVSRSGNDAYAALGDIISRGEGNYNSVNRGLVKGKNLGSFETDLSKMTINQILEKNKLKAGDKKRMNAVGKYQVIASTMKQAKKAMGLTGNEKFTKEMQERIFKEFLVPKRKGLADYLNGGKTSLIQAQYEASMEWASIPVPKGYKTQTGRISNGNVTYYDSNGGNKAKRGQGEMVRRELMSIRNSKKLAPPTTLLPTAKNPKDLANFAQNAEIPSGNPHKSQISNSSNMSASNVTIHQSFKTDMTINGAREPVESANAVKRQQENQLAFMARNVTNPLAG